MYSLFVDTHYKDLVIILFKDGHVLDKVLIKEIITHSTKLLPMVDQLLVTNHLTIDSLQELIVVNGPGSFTGVRLGVTFMKTLAYLKSIPIKPISSIQVVGSQFDGLYSVTIEENNGYFVGEFNHDFLNPTYLYLKRSELEAYQNNHDIKICDEIDYELMYQKAKDIEPVLCHIVNPLYVKKIEVQNDKKDKIN